MESVNIKELNDRIQKESAFVDMLSLEMGKVIIGQKQLVENTYTQVRPERSFTLLEDVDCPAVLAEQCFVTNDEDVEHFGSEQGCKTVARIYYEAICTYFDTEPLPVK